MLESGTKFKNLTVIELSGKNIDGTIYYACKCECGNRQIVNANRLADGKFTKCKCLKESRENNINNGKIFGWLAVLQYSGTNEENNKLYLCKCKCGSVKTYVGKNLRDGSVSDCGCKMTEERNSDNGKKFNKLTILRFSHMEGNEEYVNCQCVCGKRLILNKKDVTSCRIRGCDCIPKSGRRDKAPTENEIKRRIMKAYRKTAIERGHEFNLSREEFYSFLNKNCHYCNSSPSNLAKIKDVRLSYNGIDRVDSSKGYFLENCVPCCRICNIAKRDMKLDDFLDWISRVYRFSVEGN